jgi:hypothetical protein
MIASQMAPVRKQLAKLQDVPPYLLPLSPPLLQLLKRAGSKVVTKLIKDFAKFLQFFKI